MVYGTGRCLYRLWEGYGESMKNILTYVADEQCCGISDPTSVCPHVALIFFIEGGERAEWIQEQSNRRLIF
jgi:hypothetical protein